jgi:hypothetical protein
MDLFSEFPVLAYAAARGQQAFPICLRCLWLLMFCPSTRVQLQQLGVDSVFVFSGHSRCRWPPPHHKHQGGCLHLAQTWPEVWQLSHCVRPVRALYKSTLIMSCVTVTKDGVWIGNWIY